MKTIKAFTVTGTSATHSVEVCDLGTFQDYDDSSDAYESSGLRGTTHWNPENGSSFKTVGAACGWLKKLLKKHGWPRPTAWVVYTCKVGSGEPSVNVTNLS